MSKFIKIVDAISAKILYIIKNFILPFFFIVLLSIAIMPILGLNELCSELRLMLEINTDSELLLMILLCVITWMLCEFCWLFLIKEANTKDEYREYLIKELGGDVLENSSLYKSEDKERADTDRKTDKKDIIALMLKNNDEITEYFRISKNQVKTSFWFSVISCIVGMGALGIGIYGIVVLKDVSVSVISLVSGSISELISGTVFWVHNKSALQLNHYYDALHENEKFLSAVNIADKLSDERREEVLVEIIHKQINSETSKIKAENAKEK